jgi:hypothetical protein
VYGVAAWDISVDSNTTMRNLNIATIGRLEVDELEVAQFMNLLLSNKKLRSVIDTVTTKVVLILGRFSEERKRTLDALREALRAHRYVPILFDFERPAHRDYTETVRTLAALSRFVVADLTDPRSIPQELMAIVPNFLSVPVRAVLLGDQTDWAMFSDLLRYPNVIPPYYYSNDETLIARLEEDVVAPAECLASKLAGNVSNGVMA